jgi:hypothetical protein
VSFFGISISSSAVNLEKPHICIYITDLASCTYCSTDHCEEQSTMWPERSPGDRAPFFIPRRPRRRPVGR